ncbi:MAG TPA: hypothetical protein VKB93_01285 [Thermoanaerobaculia bacterium]|nr:hypothetical protein [Thermoanaerobaculia bacterium]
MVLFKCSGGEVVLPDRRLVLVSREDGGNLIVNPPREVWDRSELTPHELTRWSFLVAATGRAMLTALPQLAGGCLNNWEAGNWALHEDAEPRGPKLPAQSRRVHLHLLGRSRDAADASWRWGEAPAWPDYRDRFAWAANHQRLTPDECTAIVTSTVDSLVARYGLSADEVEPWNRCPACAYPVWRRCSECAE